MSILFCDSRVHRSACFHSAYSLLFTALRLLNVHRPLVGPESGDREI